MKKKRKFMQTKSFAERIHKMMRKVPHWILTVVCLGVILYLTLVPDPLGDNDMPWFPGADKLVHGIMFFGLTLCMLIDAMRSRGWRRLSLPVVSFISIIGMMAGIGIEYLQDAMDLGRGKEFWDMVADAFGAILAGTLWIFTEGTVELTEEERRHEDLQGTSEIKEK